MTAPYSFLTGCLPPASTYLTVLRVTSLQKAAIWASLSSETSLNPDETARLQMTSSQMTQISSSIQTRLLLTDHAMPSAVFVGPVSLPGLLCPRDSLDIQFKSDSKPVCSNDILCSLLSFQRERNRCFQEWIIVPLNPSWQTHSLMMVHSPALLRVLVCFLKCHLVKWKLLKAWTSFVDHTLSPQRKVTCEYFDNWCI